MLGSWNFVQAARGEVTVAIEGQWSVADFEDVYDLHVDDLFRYLARRVGPDVAEDLTAETFTEAWAHRKRFDAQRGTPGAWLQGIAMNVLRRHHRKERTRQGANARLAGRRSTMVHSHDDRVVDQETARDALSALQPALDQLNRTEREVLTLVIAGETTYTEMADTLDLPVGTVRSRLHRTRARLATHLQHPPS